MARTAKPTNRSDAKAASRGTKPVVGPLPPPKELIAAPGFGARQLYQAYLAAWNRHVSSVITGPQFAVLTAVKVYPESDQSSLAAAVALDTSTMTDLCRRLERRGLIVRVESPTDGRRKILALSPEGERTWEEVQGLTRKLDRVLLAHLPTKQRREVAGFLHDLGNQWEAEAAREVLPD